ncbi:hypothetical protein GCM10027214_13440 [Stenotrophomonas tumulicola]
MEPFSWTLLYRRRQRKNLAVGYHDMQAPIPEPLPAQGMDGERKWLRRSRIDHWRSFRGIPNQDKEFTAMNASIRKFLKEEDGVTALEYGLLAAIVAGILVATAKPAITSFFTELFKTLEAVVKTA